MCRDRIQCSLLIRLSPYRPWRNTQSLTFDQYIPSSPTSFEQVLMSGVLCRLTLLGHPWKKSYMGYDLALVRHVNDPLEHKFRARLSSRFICRISSLFVSFQTRLTTLKYLSPQKIIDCIPGPVGDAKVVKRALSAPDADRVVLDTRRSE